MIIDTNSSRVIRPWGWFQTTYSNTGYKTKIFVVNPGKRISLQSHAHRKELWSIVNGTGICTVDDNVFQVSTDSMIMIPLGAKHRIENTSDTNVLTISEVQVGDYLEEDDIIRYADDFGR